MLLESNEFVPAPGVYDAVSARLAQREGFRVAYASGGAIVRSLGLPDLGLADLSEMAARFTQIAGAAELPIIADGDNGFGNELNITRAVGVLERTGIAAVHFEDQVFPKRCGHNSGVQLVDAEQMVAKLSAALAARSNADMLIVARTDALSVESLPQTLDRAQRYEGAGADLIFVEGLRDPKDVETVGRIIAVPKLLNCGPPGSPLPLPARALAEAGFRIGIYPADLQCAAITAMSDCLGAILRDGNSSALNTRLASLAERDELVETRRWQAIERPRSS